jgi:rhodanese-related sulfurtransferase
MIRFRLIFFFFITGSLILQGQSPDTIKYKLLDPYYFHLKFITDSSSVMIDVREFFEFRRSRIKDAVNVPMTRGFRSVSDTLNKETAVFLYCTTDYRAKHAAAAFYENGFRKIYVLEGGMVFWKKEGMPMETQRLHKKPFKRNKRRIETSPANS